MIEKIQKYLTCPALNCPKLYLAAAMAAPGAALPLVSMSFGVGLATSLERSPMGGTYGVSSSIFGFCGRKKKFFFHACEMSK